MVNYCPSCGAEIKENDNFCLSCGADLQSSSGNFEQQVAQTPQQTYGQTQGYVPMQPKKSNMKLIIALIAIIVVVVIVIVVVFLLLGSGADSRFVGTWSYRDATSGMTISYKFNADKSLEVGSSSYGMAKVGTWKVNGDQLCLEASQSGVGTPASSCIKYSFSDGNTKLTLEYSGTSITLTKQ